MTSSVDHVKGAESWTVPKLCRRGPRCQCDWHSVWPKPVACCVAQELEGSFSFQSSWRQTYFQANHNLPGAATPRKVRSVCDPLRACPWHCLVGAFLLGGHVPSNHLQPPAASPLCVTMHHLPGTKAPGKVCMCPHDHQQSLMQMPCRSKQVQ